METQENLKEDKTFEPCQECKMLRNLLRPPALSILINKY